MKKTKHWRLVRQQRRREKHRLYQLSKPCRKLRSFELFPVGEFSNDTVRWLGRTFGIKKKE